jgi:hypothetical protein
MSRRLNNQVRRLAQRGATKETARQHATSLFQSRGPRTDAKVARLVDRFLNGRKKVA